MSRLVVLTFGLVAACATGVTSSGGTANDDEGGGASGGSSPTGGMGGQPSGGGIAGNPNGGAGGTPSGGGGIAGHPLWINEIHYDNDSSDTGEGIEVAGAAGLELSAYELVLYNGATSYDTHALSGTLPDQQNGYGVSWLSLPADGIQNGPSDAVALVVSATSEVLQFLSYEGTTTGSNGPASGLTSIDIGVAETATTPIGQSLQLTGSGTTYESFSWTGPVTATPGALNTGQTIP